MPTKTKVEMPTMLLQSISSIVREREADLKKEMIEDTDHSIVWRVNRMVESPHPHGAYCKRVWTSRASRIDSVCDKCADIIRKLPPSMSNLEVSEHLPAPGDNDCYCDKIPEATIMYDKVLRGLDTYLHSASAAFLTRKEAEKHCKKAGYQLSDYTITATKSLDGDVRLSIITMKMLAAEYRKELARNGVHISEAD